MYGKIRISGNILVKTGMHIGGSGAFAAIGAVDSPIIRAVSYTHLDVYKRQGPERV